jgi:hypothetical protein
LEPFAARVLGDLPKKILPSLCAILGSGAVESAGELDFFRGFPHYSGRRLTEILALERGFLFWLLSLLIGLMVGVSLFAIFGHESIMLQNRGLNSNCTTTPF